MNPKKTAVKKSHYVFLGVAFLGVYLIQDLPFSKALASELSTFSAWLCEALMNGMGNSVDRLGTRLQSVGKTPAFHFEFRDGGMILHQFYMLVPLSVMLIMMGYKPFWKILLSGVLATAVGLCFRAYVLGLNVSLWGEDAAAGWLDTAVRVGIFLCVWLSMGSMSSKAVPPGTREEAS